MLVGRENGLGDLMGQGPGIGMGSKVREDFSEEAPFELRQG